MIHKTNKNNIHHTPIDFHYKRQIKGNKRTGIIIYSFSVFKLRCIRCIRSRLFNPKNNHHRYFLLSIYSSDKSFPYMIAPFFIYPDTITEEDYEVPSIQKVVGDITNTSLHVHNFCYFGSVT